MGMAKKAEAEKIINSAFSGFKITNPFYQQKGSGAG